MLSPILNRLIEKSNKRDYLIILIIPGILTFYFGFLWKGPINRDGYNVMNFIFLYSIGNGIAMYVPNIKSLKRKIIYLVTYITLSLVLAILIIMIHKSGINKAWINLFINYQYNNPLIFLSSISFFMFFRTLYIKNKTINWVASSTLAIYLIHESEYIRTPLYKFIYKIGLETHNSYLLTLYLFIFNF